MWIGWTGRDPELAASPPSCLPGLPHSGLLCSSGFPALVVAVAGAIGSYGEYNIQTMDHQTVVHLCVAWPHITAHRGWEALRHRKQ